MTGQVVVTGLGIISPLGTGVERNWENLTRGAAGMGFKPAPAISNGFERARELSRLATMEALSDAGLWDGKGLQNVDPERVGCTVSASKPLFDGNNPMAPDAVNDFVANGFG